MGFLTSLSPLGVLTGADGRKPGIGLATGGLIGHMLLDPKKKAPEAPLNPNAPGVKAASLSSPARSGMGASSLGRDLSI